MFSNVDIVSRFCMELNSGLYIAMPTISNYANYLADFARHHLHKCSETDALLDDLLQSSNLVIGRMF